MSSDNLDIFFDLLATNNILHSLHFNLIVVGPTYFRVRNLIPFISRLVIDQIEADNATSLFQFISAVVPRCVHLQELVFGTNNVLRDHITTLINIFPTTLRSFTMSTINTMRHPLHHLDTVSLLQQTRHPIQMLSLNYDTNTPQARIININDIHGMSFRVANTLQFLHIRVPWGRFANWRRNNDSLNPFIALITQCRQLRVVFWEPAITDVILAALGALPHLRTIHFNLFRNRSSRRLTRALRSFFETVPVNQLIEITVLHARPHLITPNTEQIIYTNFPSASIYITGR